MKCGGFKVYFKPYHRENKTITGQFGDKKTVAAKKLRSSAFHILYIICMIHNTTGIGVFIIYSDFH